MNCLNNDGKKNTEFEQAAGDHDAGCIIPSADLLSSFWNHCVENTTVSSYSNYFSLFLSEKQYREKPEG